MVGIGRGFGTQTTGNKVVNVSRVGRNMGKLGKGAWGAGEIARAITFVEVGKGEGERI